MSKRALPISALVLVAALPNVPGEVFPHAATSNTVLFDREVVRLLDEHCVMCHTENGSAFALETYEQVWLARRAIHDSILTRRMPPWPAVPGYGDFANANRLTLRETRFLVSWVEGLGPRNDGEVFLNVEGATEAAEPVRAEADFETWRIGEPDQVIAASAADASEGPAAAGRLQRVRMAIDTRLDDETPIRAFEFHPAAREGLHAVAFSVEQTGQWLLTWTPWHGYRELPGGAAIVLPADARIVADFQFSADAEPEPGIGEIAWAIAAPGAAIVTDLVLEAVPASPGARYAGSLKLADETSVLALRPEAAGAGSIEVRARDPAGGVRVLLAALDPPSNWPTAYLLEQPVRLGAGTEIELVVYRPDATGNSSNTAPRLVVSAF